MDVERFYKACEEGWKRPRGKRPLNPSPKELAQLVPLLEKRELAPKIMRVFSLAGSVFVRDGIVEDGAREVARIVEESDDPLLYAAFCEGLLDGIQRGFVSIDIRSFSIFFAEYMKVARDLASLVGEDEFSGVINALIMIDSSPFVCEADPDPALGDELEILFREDLGSMRKLILVRLGQDLKSDRKGPNLRERMGAYLTLLLAKRYGKFAELLPYHLHTLSRT